MPDTAYAWAPITKTVREDDGTLLVYGPAASSALDRDQQRLDEGWLDQAMPRWLAEGGGVREQHDPKKAVGVGVGLSKGDDGSHLLTARIVDPVAVKKIEHGVLRGFSVGIKNPKVEMGKADAPRGLVVDGDVIEVSVVDRPANPGCTFALAKADGSGDLVAVEEAEVVEKAATYGLPAELYDRLATPVKEAFAVLAAGGAEVAAEVKADAPDEVPVMVNVTLKAADPDLAKDYKAGERREMAAAGQAMNDGSYPIKTKADLRRAIKAVGRGGTDHDKIRAHVIKRAHALGLEAMVPDNWNADGSLKDAEKADAVTVEKAEQVLRDVRALVPELAKADGPDGGEDESKDIDGATSAIAAIAALIISEAESLAQGNFNELCDIQLLCSAAEALKWFTCREQAEQAGDDADMALTDGDPELTKAAAKNGGKLAPPFGKKKDDDGEADDGESDEDDTADEDEDEPAAKKKAAAKKADAGELLTKADAEAAIAAAVADALAATQQASPAPEPEIVTKAQLTEMVKAAVAEARKADEGRIEALTADLAKASGDLEAIKQMPTPGGPVLTRTAAQQAQATKSDADRMRDQAQELLAKAEQFSANRDLAQGYRDRAKALMAKAGA